MSRPRPSRYDDGSGRGVTYEDIRRANEIANGPILQRMDDQAKKIEALLIAQADHVRRADMDKFREEMQRGLSDLDGKYVRRDVGEQRYQDVIQRLMVLEKADEKASDRHFTVNNNIVFWVFASFSALFAIIGLIITLVTVFHH